MMRAVMSPASTAGSDVFDDLEAEDDRLEAILAALDGGSWESPSGAAGWSILDVVVHLAQTDEAVVHTITGADTGRLWGVGPADTVDAAMDRAVRAESAPPERVFERWRTARRAASAALRRADPAHALPWVAIPLRPKALATTRLAEHWAHGLDITGPLGAAFPDTDRLRHIAWLGHRTLPYALALLGEDTDVDVYCELSGPSGDTWTFGPPAAESVIRGSAGEFCRVGAQRLRPEASHLRADGPHGAAALRALRNYAA
jgi:uncharacterized protein (TIGR03084 family)